MILDPWFYVAAAVAVLIVGMAKGGFGGGIGIVGVPLMAIFIEPARGTAILLPLLMLMDALAVRAYRGRWDWSHLQVLIPASLIGTALGFLTFRAFSPVGLRVLVAIVALVYALQYFVHRTGEGGRQRRTGAGLFWGATSGFTSFSIHAGGRRAGCRGRGVPAVGSARRRWGARWGESARPGSSSALARAG